jgi:hypothetical protein
MGFGISLVISGVLMWAAGAPTASWMLLACTGAMSLVVSLLVRPSTHHRRRTGATVGDARLRLIDHRPDDGTHAS